MFESHSAPERSESGTGRHGLVRGIDRQWANATVGDNLERQVNGSRWQDESAPEMGNRQSLACHSGRARQRNAQGKTVKAP